MEKEQKIAPFLWFNGNLEEALNLYTSVFKNTKIIFANRAGNKIINAKFQLEGVEFMALDGGPAYAFNPAISFFVNCDTQDEVDELWDKLIANGGAPNRCGWLRDKFGVSWQIIPQALGQLLNDPNPAKAKKVMDAMLQMDKIEIQKLKDAYAEA
ncbi:VOC family protein [Emticicia sp. 17c]|uniref:VOC family protein n=1 Tax=Emticicia sp. 17c TaxID=3127704 RepID=UPI00301C3DA6